MGSGDGGHILPVGDVYDMMIEFVFFIYGIGAGCLISVVGGMVLVMWLFVTIP